MPCGVCVAAMVRSRIESSDLAPQSRGCRDYCGCAATIVTVHEFSSRRSNSLVPFGRVGHRDLVFLQLRFEGIDHLLALLFGGFDVDFETDGDAGLDEEEVLRFQSGGEFLCFFVRKRGGDEER